MVVFCGAGRVKNAGMFQRFPYITDEKTGQFPKYGIEQICLMSVCEINLQTADIFKDDASIVGHIREKRLYLLRIRTVIAGTVTSGIGRFLFFHVVVSVDEIQPV